MIELIDTQVLGVRSVGPVGDFLEIWDSSAGGYKINLEPENHMFEKDTPFSKPSFLGSSHQFAGDLEETHQSICCVPCVFVSIAAYVLHVAGHRFMLLDCIFIILVWGLKYLLRFLTQICL